MNANPTVGKNEKAKWTLRQSKVNLAALLNDPRKVRRDFDLFTKTWGETFRDLPPGSTIHRSKWVPNVQPGHFADYLSKTSDRVLRHDSQSLRDAKKADKNEDPYLEASQFLRNDSNMIKSAVTAQQERDAVVKTRLALDALPKTFLRTDFDMGNPQTFASVLNIYNSTDGHRPVTPDGKQREMVSSKMLQEKLGHYLDRVEMAIVRQISLQSDAFFKAMESHEELHEYLNKTMSSVQNLITKLKQVKKNIADNSLQVINLRKTHINSLSLLHRLQMMVTVHQTQPTIQLLLSTSEYAGSLDLIKTTQEVLHQELAGLQCFRHLSCQLSEMERVICQMMRQEMDECLRNEIHRSVTEGYVCRDPHRLAAVMLGLLRQGQFEFLQEFKEEVEIAVKTIIKDTVSDAVVEEDQEKNETLAARMRMLAFNEWIDLLNKLFDNLLILLKRIKSILDLLANVAQDSMARGDVCRSRRIKKIDKLVLKKKSRLKSNAGDGTIRDPPSSGNETPNPFLDSASSSDANEEHQNPFLNGSPEKNPSATGSPSKNPFLNESPQRSKTDNIADTNNPFLEDLNDLNDAAGDHLMDGLASYEDELINSAADSFVPGAVLPDSSTEKSPHPLRMDSYNDALEKASDETIEEIVPSEECDGFLQALKDLLQWTLDFEQDRCVKVLIAKGKDSSLDKLSSSDFLKLAKSIERFASEAEDTVLRGISNENSDKLRGLNSSLRGALQTQAGKFVTRFHDERRNKLSLILDNEVWKQAEVPGELAKLLEELVKGKIPSDIKVDGKIPSVNGDARSQQTVDYLELDGERYAVVGTVLILLKMVSEYCKCADDLPASTPDLVHRLRDLLTLFNSRTCQLILGAGALQLVGLKTITTKNLALASRCLQLVLHCVPAVKRHFEIKLIQLNQSNDDKSSNKYLGVLRHFDHVVRDYQDHVDEVQNKLTAIVMSVIERQLSRWEVKAPVPSPAFRNMCKQITKFYDTVSSLLPANQICRILMNLNTELKTELRVLLLRFNVRNDGGPQHGLVTSDLTFYEANIKSLKGMEQNDLQMFTVWR